MILQKSRTRRRDFDTTAQSIGNLGTQTRHSYF